MSSAFNNSHVAGTGKSVLLKQIISWARERYDIDTVAATSAHERRKTRVAVTASTGMAAVNIGGVTLHSWAGIGLGNGEPAAYVKAILYGPGHWRDVRERWRRVKTLIIDESNGQF